MKKNGKSIIKTEKRGTMADWHCLEIMAWNTFINSNKCERCSRIFLHSVILHSENRLGEATHTHTHTLICRISISELPESNDVSCQHFDESEWCSSRKINLREVANYYTYSCTATISPNKWCSALNFNKQFCHWINCNCCIACGIMRFFKWNYQTF